MTFFSDKIGGCDLIESTPTDAFTNACNCNLTKH